MEHKWKCGKCSKIYTLKEFVKLAKEKEAKCKCGYQFGDGSERFHLETVLGNYRVSTVFLEFSRPDNWYETMIFDGCKVVLQELHNRYDTKEEAIKGHEEVVEKMKGMRLQNTLLGLTKATCGG